MNLITVKGITLNVQQWADYLKITPQGLRKKKDRFNFTYKELITLMLDNVALPKENEKALSLGDKTANQRQWAKELGISESALSRRFSRGKWSKEKALSKGKTNGNKIEYQEETTNATTK